MPPSATIKNCRMGALALVYSPLWCHGSAYNLWLTKAKSPPMVGLKSIKH